MSRADVDKFFREYKRKNARQYAVGMDAPFDPQAPYDITVNRSGLAPLAIAAGIGALALLAFRGRRK